VGTGAGGAAFVDALDGDAGEGSFVGDGAHEVGATPGPEAPVMHRTTILFGDPARVADDEGPDALGDSPLHEVFGGFVVGLVDSAFRGGLGAALLGAELAPAFGASLARPRLLGGHLAVPGLGVGEMQTVLGPQGPARDQESLLGGGSRDGVDDSQIDTSDSVRVEVVVLGFETGGDVEDEPAGVDEEGH